MGSRINFARLWEQIAELDGDRLALAAGPRTRTFSDFDQRAERLAAMLRNRGLRAGDAIGLLLHNRIEYLEAFFAASKLGCIPFNINYRYLGREIAYLLDNADAQGLIYEHSLALQVDAAISLRPTAVLIECGGGDQPAVRNAVAYDAALEAAEPVRTGRRGEGSDLLYLYTGGTTGMPKAVMWRHEDLYDALWELSHPGRAVGDPLMAIAAGRRALTALPASPLMHGTALFIALQTLAGGGTVVLCEGAGFDPAATLEAVRVHEVELLSIVGDAFARPLLDALEVDPRPVPSLKVIVSSGVQWSPSVKQALLARMPDLKLIDSLGASEGPASQSISTQDNVAEAAQFKAGGRMRVIDDLGREVVPGSGQIGLVAIVGPGPIGYLGDPDKSAATFREVDGQRVTVPGDHASVELDGTITFLGRGSATINTGGEKVFAEEVESVLRAHPAVYDCAVIGVPDPKWGERVVALVQPEHADADPGPLRVELDEACLTALAPYKRPKDYILCDGLGRSAAGKLDIVALREKAIAALRS